MLKWMKHMSFLFGLIFTILKSWSNVKSQIKSQSLLSLNTIFLDENCDTPVFDVHFSVCFSHHAPWEMTSYFPVRRVYWGHIPRQQTILAWPPVWKDKTYLCEVMRECILAWGQKALILHLSRKFQISSAE